MWISFIEAVFLHFEIRVPIEKVYGLGLSLQKTSGLRTSFDMRWKKIIISKDRYKFCFYWFCYMHFIVKQDHSH